MPHLPRHARATRMLGMMLIAGIPGIGVAGDNAHEIRLPSETAVLAPSPLPGYRIAVQKCGICHSADYINLQPPQMSLTQWTAEMVKMQRAYGAPLDDTDIKLLGIYLASAYGDASTVSPADLQSGATDSVHDAASMVPAPGLTAAELQSLADFVLKQ